MRYKRKLHWSISGQQGTTYAAFQQADIPDVLVSTIINKTVSMLSYLHNPT